MRKKFSLVNIIVPISLAAAILALFTTIFLILTNPSQFPPSAATQNKTLQSSIVDSVKMDLAKELNRPVATINVVQAEKKDWSSTALGCPKEGFVYAQVITPGYKIILEATGQKYDYRTNLKGQVILCENVSGQNGLLQ